MRLYLKVCWCRANHTSLNFLAYLAGMIKTYSELSNRVNHQTDEGKVDFKQPWKYLNVYSCFASIIDHISVTGLIKMMREKYF